MAPRIPLVEMRDVSVSFGGIRAVEGASIDLYEGEVLALVGHNGAGKSTLIKVLSGACQRDAGTIFIRGKEATIANPRDAKNYSIETIYQTLALAERVDSPSTCFPAANSNELGTLATSRWKRKPVRSWAGLIRTSSGFKDPVKALSGGQRQSVAIARAILFNARF